MTLRPDVVHGIDVDHRSDVPHGDIENFEGFAIIAPYTQRQCNGGDEQFRGWDTCRVGQIQSQGDDATRVFFHFQIAQGKSARQAFHRMIELRQRYDQFFKIIETQFMELTHPVPFKFLPVSFAGCRIASKGVPDFASMRTRDVRIYGNNVFVASFDLIIGKDLN